MTGAGPAHPLTVGTAGHVDHGKTALVAALTGVDTDRLPEEKARGLTIVLGYAPLQLPGGRQLSLVDVPGHERFVRTMVAGASGIDLYLLVVAADDGVMPQTLEHLEVVRALGLEHGLVAISKCDTADPARASSEIAQLLPGAPVIACSARTGEGLMQLRAELERVSTRVHSRALDERPARLHIDRVFTVQGRGTVVTGTLWSGALAAGEELELQPGSRSVRVRGLQVHDRPVELAAAGQRVAVNLSGARASSAQRGEVLCAPGACAPTRVLDCELQLRGARHGERVQVLHGTRSSSARLAQLDGELWQLRLERPLLALGGDRLVVRRLAPPDTLGGGTVLDAQARRHGARAETIDRLRRIVAGEPAPALHERETRARTGAATPSASPPAPAASPEQLAVLARALRDARAGVLAEAELDVPAGALAALRAEGVAVRVSGRLYAHADTLAEVRERVLAMIERDGATTLARVRDELELSRKSAQAFLEHLDAARATQRLSDDSRVLGPRAHARLEEAGR